VTAQIIDGRKIAAALKTEVADEVATARAHGARIGLATILVGDDYGSHAYVRRIGRIAAELGVQHRGMVLPADTQHDELIALIRHLNEDDSISGILVLRPLPSHIHEASVFREIDPVKDVEALHPENAGLLALGVPRYVPSTTAAIYHVLDTWLDETGQDRADFYHRSQIVVVGRSNNVGKPAVALAYDRQAAVTTVDEWVNVGNRLGYHTRRADVLVVAAGQPGLIRSEHIREGAVVLDVGINPVLRDGMTTLVGDVDYDSLLSRARAITPVPGGIGPVTDVWLMRNVVLAAALVDPERAR
jgi:methylenetetrahydrofolate dehydrogenase (NADP+) / methenyltetrahydrofolate cyclohydrolase